MSILNLYIEIHNMFAGLASSILATNFQYSAFFARLCLHFYLRFFTFNFCLWFGLARAVVALFIICLPDSSIYTRFCTMLSVPHSPASFPPPLTTSALIAFEPGSVIFTDACDVIVINDWEQQQVRIPRGLDQLCSQFALIDNCWTRSSTLQR